MTSRARPDSCALREATRQLIAALDSEDVTVVAERMSLQLECFQALQADVQRGATFEAAALAQTIAEGEDALALARSRLVEARKQLEEVRNTRASIARQNVGEPPARFISRRV